MDWAKCLTTNNAVTLDCFPTIFIRFVYGAFVLAGITAIILIILSGIKFIFSGGDAKQVEGAKNMLTYTIVGLVVILLAWFIVNVIAYVTGVTCINVAGFDNCE